MVKSRIQLLGTGEYAFPAIFRVAREEGIGALYKGFTPKVLRLAPGGGVLLLGTFFFRVLAWYDGGDDLG